MSICRYIVDYPENHSLPYQVKYLNKNNNKIENACVTDRPDGGVFLRAIRRGLWAWACSPFVVDRRTEAA